MSWIVKKNNVSKNYDRDNYDINRAVKDLSNKRKDKNK